MTAKDLSDREIFGYSDGEKQRFADPFLLIRKLKNNNLGPIETLESLALDGQEPEAGQFFGLLREVFGLKPFDEETGSGLTELETHDVFRQFTEWTERLKKNTAPGQNSPEPTESEPSPSLESPSQATNEPLPSGSAETS